MSDSPHNIAIGLPKFQPIVPRIAIVGIGGAGCNAINNLIDNGISPSDCYALNTDDTSLKQSKAENIIPLDPQGIGGIGAGCDPRVGFNATANTSNNIINAVSHAHIIFILAAMGKGTGTGGAGLIAKIAKELNIPSISIVIRPFPSGQQNLELVKEGIDALSKYTNALTILKNQNLSKLDNGGKTPFVDMLKLCDRISFSAISSIQEIFSSNGPIKLDYNDIRTILNNEGYSIITVGDASGEHKIEHVVQDVTNHPLMDEDIKLSHASSILIHITAGYSFPMGEYQQIIDNIKKTLNINNTVECINGLSLRDDFNDKVRVAFIASGIQFPNFSDYNTPCKLVEKLNEFSIPLPENKDKDLFQSITDENPLYTHIHEQNIIPSYPEENITTFSDTTSPPSDNQPEPQQIGFFETNLPKINPPETQHHETGDPVTNLPETNPPETQHHETGYPETNPPETQHHETGDPETNPPETQHHETGDPETNPPDTTTVENTMENIYKNKNILQEKILNSQNPHPQKIPQNTKNKDIPHFLDPESPGYSDNNSGIIQRGLQTVHTFLNLENKNTQHHHTPSSPLHQNPQISSQNSEDERYSNSPDFSKPSPVNPQEEHKQHSQPVASTLKKQAH